ncbi:MAG: sugar kinase [Gammaproteobacteria bacterium]|nr:sugar kinase [Gammaproteobacteria bacterium]
MPHSISSPPEILTFGEAMAMFVADTLGDLSSIERFHRRLAGADNNVAIGLSRLGFHVGWLSRVGTDSFGGFIQAALTAEGIDDRYIHADAQHGADPRVEYFRRGSAASHLTIDDAQSVDFQALNHLHATGITPALSESACQLSHHLMEQARVHGATISFDPNLRPSLWPSESVMRSTLNELAGRADWVLPGLSEGQLLTGQKTPYDIAGYYLDQGASAVIIKLGPEGSYYRGNLDGQEESFTVSGCPVAEVVDTVGAGDGFAVGVISALLDGYKARQAAQRGNLIGAQAIQVIGDMEGLPNRKRLQALEAEQPSA